MNSQIYLYDITYILADGRVLERYGLVAAIDITDAFEQLKEYYQTLNSVGLFQLNAGPHEIGEETFSILYDPE